MEDLKTCIKQYQSIDNALRALNKQAYSLREDRKCVELELGDILKDPKFSGVDKLKLEEDGSVIRIQKPAEWSKAWTLSKKDLQEYLLQFFGSDVQKAAECFMHIEKEQSKKLVSSDFNFTRIIKEE